MAHTVVTLKEVAFRRFALKHAQGTKAAVSDENVWSCPSCSGDCFATLDSRGQGVYYCTGISRPRSAKGCGYWEHSYGPRKQGMIIRSPR